MENTINDKYEIICKLGAGGTSIVYKARDLNTGKLVAVKVLREEFVDNAEQITRFMRESHTLSNLSHPNIVNILDVGQMADGRYYIATDYVDGLTLKEYIKAKGCLNFEEIIDAALQICDGLEHAHENNIIHRDIKPQNILLSVDGTLKVADFGIARVLNQNTLTMAGKDVVGSVHYISPEQARGMHLDKRSDIYSLGVVLYEMATGKLPYGGSEAITVAMKHVNQLPRKPKEVNPDIPQCLNDIILKCLAKDPALRYQSINELKQDLEGAAQDPQGYIIAAAVERSKSALRISEAEPQGDEIQPIRKHSGSETPRPENKKQLHKKLILLITAVVLALAVLIVGAVLITQSLPNEIDNTPAPSGEIEVPGVVDKTYAQAISELQALNLRVRKMNNVSLNPGEQLFISMQNPAAGTVVSAHTAIELTVEAREVGVQDEYVKMPDLRKLTKEQAEETLNNMGLVLVKVTEEENSNYAAGQVISQSIQPETDVLLGSSVEIVIASSAPKKVLPDLTGKSLAEAKRLLEDNGFVYKGIKGWEASNTVNANLVCRQEPAALNEYGMDEQIEVVVYVSTGPESIYTANLEYKYTLFNEEESASFRVVYIDSNGNEKLIEERTVFKGENAVCNYSVSLTAPAEYTVYVYKNGQLYESFPLYFYDQEGNIAYPYEGEVTINFPILNKSAAYEVVYFKGGERVVVDARTVQQGISESFVYKAVTGVPEVRQVYLYMDGAQYGEPYTMYFYDQEGNRVTPEYTSNTVGG